MHSSLIWCTFNEGSDGTGNQLLLHRQLLIAGDCAEKRGYYGSHSRHAGINVAVTEDELQNVSPDANGDQWKIKSPQHDKIHGGCYNM